MDCPKCQKPESLCVCAELAQIGELATRVHVLILQHPQEPDKDLGSARIASLALSNSTLKVGLSWPNLKKALGADREVMPSKWAVLYLGSGIKGAQPAVKPQGEGKAERKDRLVLVNKKGEALPESDKLLGELEGIVVLDGTWSQAKALWWRNAWLLKLRRAILVPARRSLYKELRKEPRGECLSTIESIAAATTALGEGEGVFRGLTALFASLLDKQRARLKTGKQI